MKKIICHLNWDICNLTPANLNERIKAVEGHIKTNAKNILPQSYCFLAYLKWQYSNKETQQELHKEVQEDLKKAFNSLEPSENENFGRGYKAIIFGNLTVCFHITGNDKDAKIYHNQYDNIEKDLRPLHDHPEVLAMKAFALGYSVGHDKSCQSIIAYEQALSHQQYKHNVEWLFGLAHSKTLVADKRDTPIKEDLFEIESLYRRVIKLDDNHALARLRLAKILIKTSGVL